MKFRMPVMLRRWAATGQGPEPDELGLGLVRVAGLPARRTEEGYLSKPAYRLPLSRTETPGPELGRTRPSPAASASGLPIAF